MEKEKGCVYVAQEVGNETGVLLPFVKVGCSNYSYNTRVANNQTYFRDKKLFPKLILEYFTEYPEELEKALHTYLKVEAHHYNREWFHKDEASDRILTLEKIIIIEKNLIERAERENIQLKKVKRKPQPPKRSLLII